MLKRLVRPLLICAALLLVAAGLAAVVLGRTNTGREYLKDGALSRIRQSISGDVQVAGINTSSSLLRGLTLHGIRVTDADGGSVLTADSVRATYSLMSLITRGFISRVTVWSPVVTVQRMDDDSWNVLQAFRLPARDSLAGVAISGTDTSTGVILVDTTGVGLRPAPEGGYELDRLEIVGGEVRMARNGGRGADRWTTYESVDARLNDLRLGTAGGDRADIDRLSVVARFPSGELDVRQLSGSLRRDGTALELEGELIELTDSRGRGGATFEWGGPDGFEVQMTLDVESLALADLDWLGLPFPEGNASGHVEASVAPGGKTNWGIKDFSATAGRSRTRGSVAFVTGETFRFTDIDLSLDPLERDVLRTWLPDGFPAGRLPDRMIGTVRGDGPPSALRVTADLSLEHESIPTSRVQVSGRVLAGENPGVEDFRVRSEALAFPTLSLLAGIETRLTGVGSLDVELEGRVLDGLSIAGHVSRLGDLGGSTARIDGRFRRLEDDSWSALGSVGLRPLVLAHLDPFFPGAELQGTAVGEISFQGDLHSLRVSTDLQTSGGPLAVSADVDAVHPAAGVSMSGFIDGLDLAALSGRVPEPTFVRGDVALEDFRTTGASPVGSARFDLEDSRLGSLDIRSLHVAAVAEDGVLVVDSLQARTSALDVSGSGSLPLTEEGEDGEVRIAVRTESLDGIRPFLLGDTVIAGDTLTDLERDVLLFEGIDPDTLQSAESVQMSGRAEGELTVRGRIGDLTATGLVVLEDAIYGRVSVESGSLNLQQFTYPGRRLRGTLTAGATGVYGREFTRSQADIALDQGRGTVSAALVQGPTEDVRVRGSFETGEAETTWFLDEFTVRLEGERWNLGGPAIVRWGEAGVRFQNVRFVRPGVDGFRFVADGTLPRRGEVDLAVSIRRLDLERMARLFQVEQSGLRGEFDAELQIGGLARRPVVDGSVSARGFGYGAIELALVEGQVTYSGRQLDGDLFARRDQRAILEVSGNFPLDLSFTDGFAVSVPDEALDVSVRADSILLADVLAFFPGYDRTEGWIDGQVVFGGTLADLEPEGELQLVDGATSINVFGVRLTDVQSRLRLERDGVIHVAATTTEGRDTVAVVDGTVTLNPVRDPLLDLTLSGNNFLAVGRRDISGRMTGDVHLGGSYRQPFIEGEVTADEGVLSIDEFVRSAAVVDLFDTTFVESFPTAEGSNPFLQGLRADVAVNVGRNNWLRSRRFSQNMNVELSGQVQLAYARAEKTIAMLGDLEAVRGTYTTVGRNFNLESGTVRFVGTPGVNPNLNFSAVNRVRTPQGPLDIDATVTGTLLAPSVRLSSDDSALSESDLYGYLIFGQPTSALSRDQRAFVQGATGFAVGTVFSQIGSLLTQDIPIDYLAISRAEFLDNSTTGQGLRSEAAATGIDIGKYIFDDVFVGVLWRPFGPYGGTNRDSFSGRVEWRFRDGWSLDLFAEDRFLRDSFTGFEQLSFDLSKVYGLFVLRQWGY